MKTIGLIGGMSWESTIPYYSIINEYMKNHLGGLHSAKLVLYNVDFAELERCLPIGDWDTITKILVKAAKSLENAGVDFILICTNTMHNVFEQVQDSISIPLIHIADATADAIKDSGYKKVALLGTKYTMTEKFYVSRLSKKGCKRTIVGTPTWIAALKSGYIKVAFCSFPVVKVTMEVILRRNLCHDHPCAWESLSEGIQNNRRVLSCLPLPFRRCCR